MDTSFQWEADNQLYNETISRINDGVLTCMQCAEEECPYRDDPYNTNGDCLADK